MPARIEVVNNGFSCRFRAFWIPDGFTHYNHKPKPHANLTYFQNASSRKHDIAKVESIYFLKVFHIFWFCSTKTNSATRFVSNSLQKQQIDARTEFKCNCFPHAFYVFWIPVGFIDYNHRSKPNTNFRRNQSVLTFCKSQSQLFSRCFSHFLFCIINRYCFENLFNSNYWSKATPWF